jgi:hypothetical protein
VCIASAQTNSIVLQWRLTLDSYSLGFHPDEAISAFDSARGHKQERQNYLSHIRYLELALTFPIKEFSQSNIFWIRISNTLSGSIDGTDLLEKKSAVYRVLLRGLGSNSEPKPKLPECQDPEPEEITPGSRKLLKMFFLRIT